MSLDCESCDALLIDLVERELDETRAAEVRAHAEGCESCGRALARLEGGRRAARELVRMEPPRLDAVLAAARARAAEVRAAASAEVGAPAPAPVPAAAPPEESWIERAVRWLGAWAARPQVAMAALLVLMVGIGLFNLPAFRARDGVADGALVEPDVRAELGPSPLAPAEQLDLQVDPHTQRVALGASVDDSQAPDERPTTTLAETEVEGSTPPTTAAHAHPTAEDGTGERDGDDELGEALAVLDVPAADGVGRVEDGPLPDIAPSTEGSAVVLAPTTPTTSGAIAPVAPPPPPVAPTAPRPGRVATSDEVEPPSTSVVGALPAAILHQARALASAGHCDEAVPRYRTLLSEHPDYADAPRAMIELAECDRRLGRLDEADRWLARAEAFPSVSADARRARTRVSTERRAVDTSTTGAAAATDEASPAY